MSLNDILTTLQIMQIFCGFKVFFPGAEIFAVCVVVLYVTSGARITGVKEIYNHSHVTCCVLNVLSTHNRQRSIYMINHVQNQVCG